MMKKSLVLLFATFVVLATAKSTLYARVYMQGRSSASDHIVALDPTTGQIKDVMQTFIFNVENAAYYGLATMDQNGIYYYASGSDPYPNLVCRANTNTKLMLSHGAYELNQLISFSFDNNQNRLLVAGALSNALGTQLVSWPTAPKSYPQNYAILDGDGSFVATTGVVDSKNQMYYWIAMPKQNTLKLSYVPITNPNEQVTSVQLQCNSQLTPLSMSFDAVRQKLLLYGGLYDNNKQIFTLYINTVDTTGKCNAVETALTYPQYISTFGYDETNQVLYVSVDSTLYTLNARTGALMNTVTVDNNLIPYSLNVVNN